MEDPQKHISLSSCQDIKKICEQFFSEQKINISHLNYIRKYDDNTVLYLCSNAHWLSHYYKSAYPTIGAFEQDNALSQQKYVLWSGLNANDKILQDSKNIIQVEHGITLIKKFNHGCEYFNLGNTDANPAVMNEYINNLEVLNKFVFYFHEKASSLIHATEQKRFLLPSEHCREKIEVPHRSQQLSKKIGAEKKNTQNKSKNIFLTARELHCVDWYLQGKTASEIAEILKISKRTVETHIENIKEKFQCRNLMQLGYLTAIFKFQHLGFIPQSGESF